MNIRNKYIYEITDYTGAYTATPLGETRLETTYEATDEFKYDHNLTINGRLVMQGADYNRLLIIENGAFRCAPITLLVKKADCNGVFRPFIKGLLNLSKGDWDLDACTVELPIEVNGEYSCIDTKNEVNIFDAADTIHRKTALTRDPRITYETIIDTIDDLPEWVVTNCSPRTGEHFCEIPYNGGGNRSLWTPQSIALIDGEGHTSPSWRNTTTWIREVITVPTAEVMGAGWTQINSGSGTKTYARPARQGQRTYTEQSQNNGFFNYTLWFAVITYDIIGTGGSASFDNGVPLGALLQRLVDNCGYTVKSDFFQIQPDNVSTTNYVTGLPTFVDNLLVYQKSDIKRSTVANNATIGLIAFEDLMENLCEQFNLKYAVDVNVFRIEHVSYFTRTLGLNLTTPQFAKYLRGSRKYSYASEKMPKREQFAFMEESVQADFKGRDIIYNTNCLALGEAAPIKKHDVGKFTNDIEYILQHTSDDDNTIGEEGFVLVATKIVNGNNIIIEQAPILSTLSHANNVLGWAYLHTYFYKHNRPLPFGTMNGTQTQFLSTVPIKKGEKITVPLCCSDVFNPRDKITSLLGVGVVDKATFNLTKETLTLELLYGANGNLQAIPIPTAMPDTAAMQQIIIIDVVANDVGYTSDWNVYIVFPPNSGTAVVLTGADKGKVKYTRLPFTYIDHFVYRLIDSYGNESNDATVTIQ